MKMNEESKVDKIFSMNVSDRERTAFELGIKLGAIFHISMGIPISKNDDVIKSIENALEKSIGCQPYVKGIQVKVIKSKVKGDKSHEFDYSSIVPENISAMIKMQYKNVFIIGKLEWNDELKYPLMYIEEIKNI